MPPLRSEKGPLFRPETFNQISQCSGSAPRMAWTIARAPFTVNINKFVPCDGICFRFPLFAQLHHTILPRFNREATDAMRTRPFSSSEASASTSRTFGRAPGIQLPNRVGLWGGREAPPWVGPLRLLGASLPASSSSSSEALSSDESSGGGVGGCSASNLSTQVCQSFEPMQSIW